MTYKLNREYKGYKKGDCLTNYDTGTDFLLHSEEIKVLLDAGYLTPILDLPDDVKADIKLVIDFVERWNKQDNELYPAESADRLRTLIGE